MPISVTFQWNGEVMVPLHRQRALCNREFVVGEFYRQTVQEERSVASHNHFFAAVHDRWLSLPDHLALQFPTEDVLRKHALIMTGFRRERRFVASSPAEARKLAAFLQPQPGDDYAIISVKGEVVVELKALSQTRSEMPEKGQFHRSKQAVLDWIDDVLGIKPATERAA